MKKWVLVLCGCLSVPAAAVQSELVPPKVYTCEALLHPYLRDLAQPATFEHIRQVRYQVGQRYVGVQLPTRPNISSIFSFAGRISDMPSVEYAGAAIQALNEIDEDISAPMNPDRDLAIQIRGEKNIIYAGAFLTAAINETAGHYDERLQRLGMNEPELLEPNKPFGVTLPLAVFGMNSIVYYLAHALPSDLTNQLLIGGAAIVAGITDLGLLGKFLNWKKLQRGYLASVLDRHYPMLQRSLLNFGIFSIAKDNILVTRNAVMLPARFHRWLFSRVGAEEGRREALLLMVPSIADSILRNEKLKLRGEPNMQHAIITIFSQVVSFDETTGEPIWTMVVKSRPNSNRIQFDPPPDRGEPIVAPNLNPAVP